MKLRTALFTMALFGLLAPSLLSAQNAGKETASLPETKTPQATAAAQTAPAPAQASPATPATTASGHPNDDYWRKHDQQLLTDFPWLARFKEDDLKLGPPAPGEDRVVFMGDSITQGWHLDVSFPGKPYINRGISGQTTPQMVLRFHQDVIQLKPKVVIILAGINDIAGNTGPMTLEETEDNLASMAEIATANQIKVVLCSVLPAFDFPWSPGQYPAHKVVALNDWIKTYAEAKGFVYVNFYSPMKDDRGGLPPTLSKDGVHPLPAGYAIMAPLAEAGIEKAVKQ
ncbi:MAG TPA: SGNH/GDSL hydrolase family protein [Terracidiphilus sp.]|nr:SGNH/GDSL hydrolase family protein [Terracidiphilus sp.]